MRSGSVGSVRSFSPAWYEGSGRLAGKVTLITNPGHRVTQAVAVSLAREGASVVIPCIAREGPGVELFDLIDRELGQACLVQTPPGSVPAWLLAARYALKRFSRLDLLIDVESPPSIGPERQPVLSLQATIRKLFDGGCAPRAVVCAIDDADDFDNGADFFSAERRFFTLGKALREYGIRVNAVKVWGLQNFQAASDDDGLAEIAAAVVLLSSDESSDLTGTVFANEAAC